MARHFAANFLSILIVGLIVLGGVVYWGKTEYESPGPLETAIFFEVPKGGNIFGVSERLADVGAIRSALVMRIAARYTEKSSQLKFGSHEIPAHSSIAEIMDVITKGGRGRFQYTATYRLGFSGTILEINENVPGTDEMKEISILEAAEVLRNDQSVTFNLTVAEGMTSHAVVEGLKQIERLSGDAISVPAEGSLAPNTYAISKGDSVEVVLARMMREQERILDEAWENRMEGLPYKNKEEALIMASIIEKETGISSERSDVAAVFVNRLNKGMRLQTDPTVIYGLTLGKETLGRGLRRSELAKETPYNTYVIDGLPPTPIANPGKEAIEAALNPSKSDNLYFVADGSGGHVFSRTLAEHNRNVAKWRRIEAEEQKSAAE